MIESEGSGERVLGEDDPGEIGGLEVMDQIADDFGGVIFDVEQDRAAIAGDHDLAGLRWIREFAYRVEAGIAQSLHDIDDASDG